MNSQFFKASSTGTILIKTLTFTDNLVLNNLNSLFYMYSTTSLTVDTFKAANTISNTVTLGDSAKIMSFTSGGVQTITINTFTITGGVIFASSSD